MGSSRCSNGQCLVQHPCNDHSLGAQSRSLYYLHYLCSTMALAEREGCEQGWEDWGVIWGVSRGVIWQQFHIRMNRTIIVNCVRIGVCECDKTFVWNVCVECLCRTYHLSAHVPAEIMVSNHQSVTLSYFDCHVTWGKIKDGHRG